MGSIRGYRVAIMACGVAAVLSTSACSRSIERSLEQSANELSKAVASGRVERVRPWLLASQGPTWSESERDALAKDIAQAHARPRPVVAIGPDRVVELEATSEGYRFSSDPTQYYGRGTPREALVSFVRATRAKRWDVVLSCAPQRFRAALTVEQLAEAWITGESGEVLRAARDRLAEHLRNPIVVDAHHAVLVVHGTDVAVLEREGASWVVVDF